MGFTGYRLAVDLGTTCTVAAIRRGVGTTELVILGQAEAAAPSVAFLGADGAIRYGAQAEAAAAAEPGHAVRGFVRRIGDETPVPLADGSTGPAAHALAAGMIAWVVQRATEQEGAPPAAVVITHPGTWGPHKRDLLAGALAAAGVGPLTLLPEPAAVLAAHPVAAELPAGSLVAVYDFGGGTFDAALLRTGESGAATPVGRPAGLSTLGGADLDDLVLAHVLGQLGERAQQAAAALAGAEPGSDDVALAALTRLRRDCVQAKETLSRETAATVTVGLGGAAGTRIRLTRADLDSVLAPTVASTIDVLVAMLADAQLDRADLACVLLAGGSARIPLVAQLVSSELGAPVIAAPDGAPELAVVHGALSAQVLAPAQAGAAARIPAPAGPVSVPAVATGPAERAATAAAPTPLVVASVVVDATSGAPSATLLPCQAAEAPAGVTRCTGPAHLDGRPILPRRAGSRAQVIGLERHLGAPTRARSTDPMAPIDARPVVPARDVQSVQDLLTAPAWPLTPVTALSPGVPSAPIAADPGEDGPPQRPPLSAPAALEHDPDDQDPATPAPTAEPAAGEPSDAGTHPRPRRRPAWHWRSLCSVRRVLAVGAITTAVFLGSNAWVQATSPVTESGAEADTPSAEQSSAGGSAAAMSGR